VLVVLRANYRCCAVCHLELLFRRIDEGSSAARCQSTEPNCSLLLIFGARASVGDEDELNVNVNVHYRLRKCDPAQPNPQQRQCQACRRCS
jgi:hypothetical protein